MAKEPFSSVHEDSGVLQHLWHTHDSFLATLTSMAGLPSMVEQLEQTRSLAGSCLTHLDDHMIRHHATEEEVIFPAVLRNARTHVEREQLAALTADLTAEHRNIEQLWEKVAPALDAVRDGRPGNLDTLLFTRLLRDYLRHVMCEENEYLPLAREVLGSVASPQALHMM
jgi:hemerythrin-like domain-containing protein